MVEYQGIESPPSGEGAEGVEAVPHKMGLAEEKRRRL